MHCCGVAGAGGWPSGGSQGDVKQMGTQVPTELEEPEEGPPQSGWIQV